MSTVQKTQGLCFLPFAFKPEVEVPTGHICSSLEQMDPLTVGDVVFLQPPHECLPSCFLGQIPAVHPTRVLLPPPVGVRHGCRGVWFFLEAFVCVCVFSCSVCVIVTLLFMVMLFCALKCGVVLCTVCCYVVFLLLIRACVLHVPFFSCCTSLFLLLKTRKKRQLQLQTFPKVILPNPQVQKQ